ncbi:MAG: C25 family cysteine peptidase [Candidatus Acidiferrales bacterium]
MCEELLGRGLNVRFRANGRSMQPNILDEDAVVVAPGVAASANRGEITLTHSGQGFRVHRVVENDHTHPRQVITRGDAGLMNDPSPALPLGKIISIERGRRRLPVGGARARMVHKLRTHGRRVWLAGRRRAGAPVLGAVFFMLLSVLAASPASAQSLNVTLSGTSPVAPGGTITYTAVVSNSSLSTVTGPITVSMPDPATTTFVSAGKTSGTGTWTCNNTGGTITCADNGNLGALINNSATLSFVVTVNNTGATSTYTIPSTVTAKAANTSPVNANTTVTVQILAFNVTNAAAPSPIAPGDTLTYTVGISNTSGAALNANETVSMPDPVNLTLVSAAETGTGTGTWTCNNTGGTVTCTDTANYVNGGTTTFAFVFTVNAGTANGTVITGTASAQAANSIITNTASANVTVQTPDLSVTNTPNPTQVATGGTITYTQVITNNGAEEAIGASFTENTPTNTTFTSVTAPAGWTCGILPAVGGTGTITCTANAGTVIAASGTATLTVVVTVNPGATVAGTTISDTVTVSETGTDPNSANNSTTASVTVAAADLAMTQTVSPAVLAPTGTITYTEAVTNNGPNAAANVSLYQQTPPNTTFASMTPPAGWACGTVPAVGGTGQVICTIASLASNTTTTNFVFKVTVNSGVAAGTTIQNYADVTSQTADPVVSNNSTQTSVLVEQTGNADLGVTAWASPTPVFIDSTLIYTVQVTNYGLTSTTATTLTDTLPAGVTFVSAISSQGTCTQSSGTVSCSLGAVAFAPSSPITISITVTTSGAATTLTNTASVSSTSPTDPFSANNTASVITVVQPLVCAMPGKDGAGGTLTGVVNAYYPPGAGVTSANAGTTSVTLGAASGASKAIAVGDLLLFIQTQGATINTNAATINTGAYGDGVPGDPGSGSTSLSNSGQYEFVTATSAVPVGGGTLTFTGTGANSGLLNTYAETAASAAQGQATFQVIRVPQYSSATLSSSLTALTWNGKLGGVLALDISSQLTLSGAVSLDGQGFRGGGGRILTGGTGAGTDYVTLSTDATNGSKGEGIAGTPTYISPPLSGIALTTTATATGQTYVEGLPSGSYARGAPGNAGGGATDADPPANDQNSGGGGGGNGGTGGVGGFGWNSAGIVGGFGGVAFPGSTSAIIMGGGGGAGSTNNGAYWVPASVTGGSSCGANCTGIYSSGMAGGGIAIIRAGSVTGTGTITANGVTALEVENDGGGGGGAGGSILFFTNTGGVGGLTIQANGGDGGITWPEDAPGTPFPRNRHGPGGGGGGGMALLTGVPASLSLLGGAPGYTTLADDSYGATPGQMGSSNTGLTVTQTPGTQSGAYCAGADLAVTNSANPTIVLSPGTITYTQTVANNGPYDALNAVFSEAIPANTTFQSIIASGSGAAGWTCTAVGSIVCSNPDVPSGSGGNTTFTVVVNVVSGVPSGTQIIDIASVTSGTNDPNLANNTASAIVLVAAAGTADLSITQTATPNPVAAGGAITYTITVKNNGLATATTVNYTEVISSSPGYARFGSLSCPSGWSCTTPSVGGTGTVTGSIANLASGATATLTLVLNVNAATPSGTVISETANINSSLTDPNPENNVATTNVVVASAGQYDLRVTSSASPNPVLPGNNITYTQTLANAGPASASGVQFSGSVPVNTTFVSLGIPAGWICTAVPAAGGTGAITCCPGTGATCSGAALPSGTLVNFPMVVNVVTSTPPGTIISNTISVTPTGNDVTTGNNTVTSTTVVASPSQGDISIVKTASPEPVDQGTNLTYTLRVTNNGPAVASNVSVSDPLPTEVTFTSVSTTQGTCSQSAGTVVCSLGTLSVGSQVTVIINANASTFSSTTYATNTATVTSSTGDPNPANNTSSVTSTIETPTAVQLSDLHAEVDPRGGVLIEWHTKEEVRNLGFHIYREDAAGKHRLDPSLIAGSALVMRGGRPQHAAKTYQWTDPAGNSSSSYWIEDVDLNGTRTMHGPVQPEAPSPVTGVTAFVHVARPTLLTDLNRAAAAGNSASTASADDRSNSVMRRRNGWPRPGTSPNAPKIANATLNGEAAVKIYVSQSGWYRLTGAQIEATGFNDRDARTLQLYAEGVEQPMLVQTASSLSLGANGTIEFYGTGIDTPFSGTRVYWLVNGTRPGLRIAQSSASGSQSATVTDFSATTVLEQRTTYFAALLNGEDNENFFGALITSAPVDQILTATHIDASSSTPVTLDVTLQGGTDQQQHSVSISFNGSYVGEMDFANQANTTNTFTVDSGLLREGANTLTLAALNGDNDVSLVQSIMLRYPHTYTAESDWLDATAPTGSIVHIGGFTNSQIQVFDVRDAASIAQLSGPITLDGSGTYGITVQISASGPAQRTLVALSADQVASPDALAYHAPNNLDQERAGASYVVITHPDFESSVAPLVSLHKSDGDQTMVVTTDEVYDAFNYGEKSPFAIRSFLQEAAAGWRVRPQAILLVGDASIDPRNYLGMGDLDFVPSRMIQTAAFKTASDDWLTDFNGSGYATIPTGRIPADTPEQAALAVSKIVAYETGSTAGAWQQTATFIADQNVGADFSSAAQSAATLAPKSLNINKILIDGEDPSTAQQQIVAAIDSGTGLVNYSGHGAEDQWSFGDIFDDTTVRTLTNGDKQPVFLLMDCLNGFFEDVYSNSLAEDLLFAPNGGASAVWASSGFTEEPPQATMNEALMSALAANPNQTLGQAILKAKSGIADDDVRRTWTLFGDPAMRLPIPAAPKSSHKH